MTAAAVSIVPTTVIEPPGGAFIAGQWQTTKLPVAVRNPENGEHVGWVARSSRADVDRAVTALRHGLGREWPLYRRRAALTEASFLLAAQAERFARLISTEGCKTVVEAEREVARAVETLRLSGECADALTGETLPLDNTERGAGRIGWFVRAPVGIVAAITPFNDPLNLVAHKLGPALLAGNGVILKPHEATPLTALAFAEVLIEAGVPGDRLAVVCGEAETGGHVVTHPQVDVISFTGGPRTAARISAMAGPRRLLMELGGNNPTLVCADADPTAAAAAIVEGAFGVAGQNCLSVQRVYIARELFDLVSAAVVAKTRALVVGSKRSRRTQVGPMINEGEARRVEEWVADAVARGAQVLAGGTRNGSLHTPTVLADVPDGARIAVEEVFGPVVCLFAFDTVEEAIDRANSTHALHAGVFTRDIDAALRISGRLVAGAVLVNDTSDYRIDAMPFGGFGRSGIGREGIKHAIEAMTEPKSYIVKSISGNHAQFANAIRRHNEVDPKDPGRGAGRDHRDGPRGVWWRERRHRDAGGRGVEPDRRHLGQRRRRRERQGAAPQSVKDKGTLVVAMELKSPPTTFLAEDGKTPIGFNPDMARLIAKKLGLQVEIVDVGFDTIIPALQGKRYDMTASSMSATAERVAVVDMIDYLKLGAPSPSPRETRTGTPSTTSAAGKSW